MQIYWTHYEVSRMIPIDRNLTKPLMWPRSRSLLLQLQNNPYNSASVTIMWSPKCISKVTNVCKLDINSYSWWLPKDAYSKTTWDTPHGKPTTNHKNATKSWHLYPPRLGNQKCKKSLGFVISTYSRTTFFQLLQSSFSLLWRLFLSLSPAMFVLFLFTLHQSTYSLAIHSPRISQHHAHACYIQLNRTLSNPRTHNNAKKHGRAGSWTQRNPTAMPEVIG